MIEDAQRWIVHLGNVAAPLAGVVLVDYVVVKRRRIDVAGALRPARAVPLPERRQRRGGRSRSPPASALYYALPHSWLKIAWGLRAPPPYDVPRSCNRGVSRYAGAADGRLLPALELALVDVALLGRPQLAAGELALVDRVVELARREAVADPVQVLDRCP